MREALEALQWYVDAGVDEALDDHPRDYFATPPATAPLPKSKEEVLVEMRREMPAMDAPKAQSATLAPIMSASFAACVEEAQKLADGAETLEALEAAVRGFEGCQIKRTATNTVFCDGDPKSRLMLIGEAPGAQEDIQGIPFCGPSGALLDKMLAAIGYDRTSAYITNTIFWRPPGNRQPSAEELAICKPFLERHIALIDPALIVLVGGTATKAVLGTEQGITKLRGKNYTYRTPYKDKEYPVSIVYHPSYLLRQPANKRATWQDLLAIKAYMDAL